MSVLVQNSPVLVQVADDQIRVFGLGGSTPSAHVHSASDITSGTLDASRLPTGIDAAKIGGGTISNAEFACLDGATSPLQAQLDTAAAGAAAQFAAISVSLAGKANTSHTHSGADITSGTVPPARLGSGTPTSTTLLDGSGAWRPLTGSDIPQHSAALLNSGTLDVARLNGGTNAQFVRADGVNSNTLTGFLQAYGLNLDVAGIATASQRQILGHSTVGVIYNTPASTRHELRSNGSTLGYFQTDYAYLYGTSGVMDLCGNTRINGGGINLASGAGTGSLVMGSGDINIGSGRVVLGNSASVPTGSNAILGTSLGPTMNAATGLSNRISVAGTVVANFGSGFGNTTSYCWAVGRHGVATTADYSSPGIASAGANVNYHTPYQHIMTNGATPRYNWRSGYALGVLSDYAWGAGEYATSLTVSQAGIGSDGSGDLFSHVASGRYSYLRVNGSNDQRRGSGVLQFLGLNGAVLGNASNTGQTYIQGGGSGSTSAGAMSLYNGVSRGSDPGCAIHYTGTNAGCRHIWYARDGSFALQINENGLGAVNANTPIRAFSPIRSVGSFQQGANGICSPPIEIPRGGTNIWMPVTLGSPNPVQTTTTGNDVPGGWWSVFTDSSGTNTASNHYQLDDLIPIDTSRAYAGEVYAKLLAGTTGAAFIGCYCYNSAGSNIGTRAFIANAFITAGGNSFSGTISGEGAGSNQFAVGTKYIRLWFGPNGTGAWSIALGPLRLREIPHQCACSNNATQSVATGTWTSVNLQAESIDTSSLHDTATNNDRIAIPRTGNYQVNGAIEFAGNATGIRRIQLARNGTALSQTVVAASNLGASEPAQAQTQALLALTAGDYITMQAFQDSGGALNLAANNCRLSLIQIS